MFDKFKQLKKLKDMQDSLSSVKSTANENGVKVTVNGKMEVINVSLNEDLDKSKQEKALKKCINEALDDVKKQASKQMKGQFGL